MERSKSPIKAVLAFRTSLFFACFLNTALGAEENPWHFVKQTNSKEQESIVTYVTNDHKSRVVVVVGERSEFSDVTRQTSKMLMSYTIARNLASRLPPIFRIEAALLPRHLK